MIDVALTNTTLVAADPPMVTVAPEMKPVPVIVTGVPPKVEPDDGETAVTVGGVTAYVYIPEPVPDSVLGFVTIISLAPTTPAGVTALNDVALTHTTLVAADPPTVTVAPDTNPVPVIVTTVPPAVEPLTGDTEVTVGGAPYVYKPVPVPANPDVAVFVTTMFVAPAELAGVVAVMLVALTTVTPVAEAEPNRTVAPLSKSVPVMVTDVPPAMLPPAGVTAVTVGTGA